MSLHQVCSVRRRYTVSWHLVLLHRKVFYRKMCTMKGKSEEGENVKQWECTQKPQFSKIPVQNFFSKARAMLKYP